MAAKFESCASRTLPRASADAAWSALAGMERFADTRELTALFACSADVSGRNEVSAR
jgi:hypothetical protein